jgi:OOP family OmpA-OmpF porin
LKTLYIFFLFFFTVITAIAQPNLVPNGDFEYYTTCPSMSSQILRAYPWFQPFVPAGSSDYFNCTSIDAGVPSNLLGFQTPHSGNGYAGFQVYSDGLDIREYIEVKLSDSLVQGTTYCVNIYIVLSEVYHIPSDRIGIYFSHDSVLYSTPFYGVLNYIPQVENLQSNFITDSINWTRIYGEFTATGNEKFITIGNFKTDSNTDTIYTPGHFSYFYIDDVSVVAGSCNVGIDENELLKFAVSPNPVKDYLSIKLNNSKSKSLLSISDITGRIVDRKTISEAEQIDCSKWMPGVYFVSVADINGKTTVRKVVKF